MDAAVLDSLARALACKVDATHHVGGGDVAESFRLDLADGRRMFAKTHRAPPPHFFSTEAAGLRWLAEPDVLPVARVAGVSDDPPWLALEWIVEGGRRSNDTEADFGHRLALLHRNGAATFGRIDRRTTGSRGLPNEPCETWAEFYASQRLLPLARLAAEGNHLPGVTVGHLERVAQQLDQLGGPTEPPARLHGDLWAGNRLVADDGESWLIDPAAHGGHREFDLAMMRLFGGFGDAAFAAYHDEWPIADGWEDRVPLHQLAPLVVHAIKFGGSYVGATQQALASLA